MLSVISDDVYLPKSLQESEEQGGEKNRQHKPPFLYRSQGKGLV